MTRYWTENIKSIIHVLKVLMKRVDNVQDWIGNLSREVETIKKVSIKNARN